MPTDPSIIKININDIITSNVQPRKYFDEESIKELALSIKTYGILNPLLVRRQNDKYELVAGERRYRAAKMLGLTEIPVIIKDLTDTEAKEIALIENIQRNNLNPIEEAEAYKEILELNNITQEELSKKIGKVQSSVSNKIRLLNLSEEVKDALLNGKISERHGRLLLKLENEDQNKVLKEIINNKLSVKDTEELINQKSSKNNILNVLNSIDIDNKDSNIFNDVEKEIKEKGEDNMNNTLGGGSFFPQFNNDNLTENNTIMFNNSPMNTNIPENNTNTVPLTTLSQEPTISTILGPTAPEPYTVKDTEDVPTETIQPIETPLTIPQNNEQPSSFVNSTIPLTENIDNNININIEPTAIPNLETPIPSVETPMPTVDIMPEPPLFNPNISSVPPETTISYDKPINVSINNSVEIPKQISSEQKIKDMLKEINDSKVTVKEYSNSTEKCIIITIQE